MGRTTIDHLIINSPFVEPTQYWNYESEYKVFTIKEGRRPSSYVIASESASPDDPGRTVPIPLVNKIRPLIKAWREGGYQHITGVTRELLEHWNSPEERENKRFFFCQLEAIETLIWLREVPDKYRDGVVIEGDGGEFQRLCSKMATGSGKTVVMAMVIAWNILNSVAYPDNPRFSRYILLMAPGLTVRDRLKVLIPSSPGNYYDEFNIVPPSMIESLRQGRVIVRNWQALSWENEEQLSKKRSVDKRGAKSHEAYVREVLAEMSKAHNIVVINDEAHHAWRVPAESKVRGVKKEDIEEATVWVSGLDRIHRQRNIICCYDFSATPFAPSGKKSSEEALFNWIVSDFGLNDAIESGLVKTPRIVVRDDSTLDSNMRSKLYHIYNDPKVKEDLNQKSAKETDPLPDLVVQAYNLLGKDWLETYNRWKDAGMRIPPVMITVANRTETAARIKYYFDHKKFVVDELCVPDRTLHIDSEVLDRGAPEINSQDSDADGEEDSEGERKRSKKDQEEMLRARANTVGQIGKPGEKIQNIISVGMLSEGWDTKTVTHIMGLRSFSSQLLCEQVVGRGLRRTAYDVNPGTGLYEPEYVNIFGVPFSFIPHEGGGDGPKQPPLPQYRVEPDESKIQYEISWPNIVRVEHIYRPKLSLDLSKVQPIQLDIYDTPMLAELAPTVDGKPDLSKLSEINLRSIADRYRLQKIVFETARDVFDQIRPSWKGNKDNLLAQIFRIVESFIASDKVLFIPPVQEGDDTKKRILMALNMQKIVRHVFEAIRFENTETIVPVFDTQLPIRSTGDMRTWWTSRRCEPTRKSHINLCVFDSAWEASEAFELDRNDKVEAWVKNDHLGFEIAYIYDGAVRKYRPDFIVRLSNDHYLVLEVKGRDTLQDQTKRVYLDEWIRAVNVDGRFGHWEWAMSKNPPDLPGIIDNMSRGG